MSRYDAISEAVIAGDEAVVRQRVQEALDLGDAAEGILGAGLIHPMSVLGERMAAGEVFLPEVLMSATAMHRGLDIIRPLLVEGTRKSTGTVVLGTVKGDIHDIGKRLVGLMLEGNGFDVIDLGVDVPIEAFADAVEMHNPDIVGMSALLTTTMPNMRRVIEMLEARGLRQGVKVIVGGASVNQDFADSIGADGFSPDAGSAIRWAKDAIAQ